MAAPLFHVSVDTATDLTSTFRMLKFSLQNCNATVSRHHFFATKGNSRAWLAARTSLATVIGNCRPLSTYGDGPLSLPVPSTFQKEMHRILHSTSTWASHPRFFVLLCPFFESLSPLQQIYPQMRDATHHPAHEHPVCHVRHHIFF